MMRVKVGVLRGGPSSEYEISLKSGGSVLKHLPEKKYEVHDILITKDGVWHMRGLPVTAAHAIKNVDVIFNALHGPYGEDGKVQQMLNTFGVPYTGSGILASAIGMNKLLTKRHIEQLEIKTPNTIILEVSPELDSRIVELFRTLPQPSVIKPASTGSSIGVSVIDNFEDFSKGIKQAFEHSSKVLIEQYISGREATCAVVEHFRGKDIYVLPPVEIIPPAQSAFFDYDAKYSNKTQEICPANFTQQEKEVIEQATERVHRALGLRHYSRSDFIIAADGIYFLEVNTLPGLTPGSLVPKALEAVGCSFPDFLDHIVTLARTPTFM